MLYFSLMLFHPLFFNLLLKGLRPFSFSIFLLTLAEKSTRPELNRTAKRSFAINLRFIAEKRSFSAKSYAFIAKLRFAFNHYVVVGFAHFNLKALAWVGVGLFQGGRGRWGEGALRAPSLPFPSLPSL